MRILFLAFEVPYPLDRGGRIKTFHYLKALTRSHQVDLVALTRTQECEKNLDHLQSNLSFEDVYSIPINLSQLRKVRLALKSLWQTTPFVMALYASTEGKRLLERLLNSGHFDLIYADHLHMAQYVPGQTLASTLLDQHNVESVILRRFVDSQSSKPLQWFARLEYRKMSRYEPEMCRRFDAIWVTTEVDKKLIAPWLLPQQHVQVLPIGVDTDYFQPESRKRDGRTLISIGTLSWPPNADGVLWFYGEVYSLIKKRVPNIKFVIVGANPPPAIRRLAEDPSVEVTGWVDDIRPLMARSTAMVVPLRSGSGMRVKILNALATGLPVVSTSVGCEGIAATPGDDILIADDGDTYVQRIVTLLKDQRLQRKLSKNGDRLIQERYSWNAIYDQIEASVAAISECASRNREKQ